MSLQVPEVPRRRSSSGGDQRSRGGTDLSRPTTAPYDSREDLPGLVRHPPRAHVRQERDHGDTLIGYERNHENAPAVTGRESREDSRSGGWTQDEEERHDWRPNDWNIDACDPDEAKRNESVSSWVESHEPFRVISRAKLPQGHHLAIPPPTKPELIHPIDPSPSVRHRSFDGYVRSTDEMRYERPSSGGQDQGLARGRRSPDSYPDSIQARRPSICPRCC
ncbi:hypothetical protein JCM16303_005489 [Sporobolomyces ruberrimus]